jgi:hypothetical protein
MRKNTERFKDLFKKYTSKSCSETEKNEFLEMVADKNYVHVLKKLIKDEVEDTITNHEINENKVDEIFNKIVCIATAEETINIHSVRRYAFRWRSVAAAVLIVLAGSVYLFLQRSEPDIVAKNVGHPAQLINDIAPGHSGAILTLGNGKTIVLDSAHNGLLVNQGRINIIKQNGQITYQNGLNSENNVMYNTMTTPKGRQYQLVLSDGSQVWLNAASSITYPTAFVGKERKVTITGEAYFEVAKDPTKPFSVFVSSLLGPGSYREDGAEIQVLGTHFNVNAYGNENAVRATLLEGKIKFTGSDKSVIINPGQQAILDNHLGKTSVAKADVSEAIAWKQGFFSFKNATIETIMRQVERWYDVKVVYSNVKPGGHYRGEVSRNVNASEILKVLEISGIHFKIEGKKIIVM